MGSMRQERIKTGDRVKIVDRNSKYFRKTGIFKNAVRPEPLIKGQKLEMIFKIKLDDIEEIEDFFRSQFEIIL